MERERSVCEVGWRGRGQCVRWDGEEDQCVRWGGEGEVSV